MVDGLRVYQNYCCCTVVASNMKKLCRIKINSLLLEQKMLRFEKIIYY